MILVSSLCNVNLTAKCAKKTQSFSKDVYTKGVYGTPFEPHGVLAFFAVKKFLVLAVYRIVHKLFHCLASGSIGE